MGGQLEIDVKSLEQRHIGQKYKVVNDIMKKVQNSEYDLSEIGLLLKQWVYTDDPSMILYLSLVNFRKISDIVIKFLKSEDDVLVCRTLRICTFFWTDKTYTLSYYITNIFPFLSYSNRNNFLKSLAKNLNDYQAVQKCFEHVKQIYGISVARPFLIYCSVDYIKSILEQRIVLTNREMKLFLKKDSKFILDYICTLCDLVRQGTKFVTLISLLNIETIIRKLVIIYTSDVLQIIDDNKKWLYFESYGRSTTKRILRANKSIILKDPKYYKSVLQRSMLFRLLEKEDYKIFFKGLFPKQISFPDWTSTSWDDWETLFSYLDYCKTKDKKLDLLLDSYKSVYGKDLLADPKNITPKIMKLLDAEPRIQFAKEKIARNNDFDMHKWTCYLTCDEALPALKQEIYITPNSNDRIKYLEYMITCCHINDDFSSTLEVLKYFNQRHRNEDYCIKDSFLRAIQDNINLDKFNSEHWKEIEEIISVCILNNDLGSLYNMNSLMIGPIKFSLCNDYPLVKHLTYYIKWANLLCIGDEPWNLFKNNPTHEKKCLFMIGELIPKVLLEENFNSRVLLNFLSCISSWNKRHSSDIISAMDFKYWTVDAIKKILMSDDDYEKTELIVYFKHDKKIATFFEKDLKTIKYKIDVFKLKTIFVENSELVMKQIKEICANCSPFFLKTILMPLLRSYKIDGVNELKEKLKLFCLDVVDHVMSNRHESSEEDKDLKEFRKLMPGAIRFLSYILPFDKFYSIVKPFYPKDSRIDLSVATTSNIFEIQKSIVFGLTKYVGYSDTFEALKFFCAGDYLKFTIGSLNCVCIKSSLYKTAEFLNTCIDVPVSFKKHVIRLLVLTSDKAFTAEFLQKMCTLENNPSIRQVLLHYMFNSFIEEPEMKSWMLIKNSIESLSVKDKHSLNTILKYEDVSEFYLSKYVHVTWSVIKRLESEQTEFKSYKVCVINGVMNLICSISENVLQELLKNELFLPDASIAFFMCELAALYVLTPSNKTLQESRINFIISEMKTCFESSWNLADNEGIEPSYVTRKSINYFIEHLCVLSICNEKYEETSKLLFPWLLEKLNLIFDPSLFIYSSYIMIHLSIIFKQVANLREFGVSLKSLVDKEIQTYGMYIIQILTNTLKVYLAKINQKNVLEVTDGLLSEPMPSVGCAYLAIDIATLIEIFKPENANILNRLSEINDKKINMMLNMYY